jgi:hypothetical protein
MTRPTHAPTEYRVERRGREWVLLARIPPSDHWFVLPTAGGFAGAWQAIPFYEAAAARWHARASYRDCKDCGRPMRRRAWKKEHHPGTVAEESNGRCRGCAKDTGPDPYLAEATKWAGTATVRALHRYVQEDPAGYDYLLAPSPAGGDD